MTAADRISPNRRPLFRAGLIPLAAIQAFLGLYALVAPRSFYEDFPLGRGWVAALPSYSEHLVRDVGGLFLATAVILGAAALWLDRRLVLAALASFLAFSLPHTTYHLFNLEVYGAADALANVVTLGATVLVPVALLVLALRREPEGPAPTSTPGGPAEAGAEGRTG